MPRNRCLGRRRNCRRDDWGCADEPDDLKVFASGADGTTWRGAIRGGGALSSLCHRRGVRRRSPRRSPPTNSSRTSPTSTRSRSAVERRPRSTRRSPRITTRGTTARAPEYKGAKRLAPGPHHYLVQFVGPVKPEWLDAVREAGGEVVDTYSGFTVVVRADDDADRADRPAAGGAVGRSPADARPESTSPIPTRRRCPAPNCFPTPWSSSSSRPREARKGTRRDPRARADASRRDRVGRRASSSSSSRQGRPLPNGG